MTKRLEIDVREIARVASSGTIAYLGVHFFLLPFLVRMGVGFPTYLYIGVLATGVVSVVLSLAMRPRQNADETAPTPASTTSHEMFPAE